MSRQSCRSRLHAACRSVLAGALALFFLLPAVQNAAAMEVEPAGTDAGGYILLRMADCSGRGYRGAGGAAEQGLALTEGQTVSLTLDIPQARRIRRRRFLPCGSERCAGQYNDGGLGRASGR